MIENVDKSVEIAESLTTMLDSHEPSETKPWAVEVAVSLTGHFFPSSKCEVASELGLCKDTLKTGRTDIEVWKAP